MNQSLIIVQQLTAIEMDNVEIHQVGSHAPATKATLDRHVNQSLIIVHQLSAVEMDDVEIHPVGSHVSAIKATLDRHVK